MTKLTGASHPHLFKVLIELDYDNGHVHCGCPEKTEITVPTLYEPLLAVAELELAEAPLTGDELLTFVGGEETEMEELVKAKHLEVSHFLLNAYFEGLFT